MTDTDDVYDLMRELMRENPDLSERTLIRKWRDTVLDDPDMTNGVLDLAGLHIYNAVLSQTDATGAAMEERARRQIARSP